MHRTIIELHLPLIVDVGDRVLGPIVVIAIWEIFVRVSAAAFVTRFSADVWGYGDRHRVPVGLTGWAQIHGLRGDTSIEERARFDNQYIEHWSLWRDLVVLVRTCVEVVRGARQDR